MMELTSQLIEEIKDAIFWNRFTPSQENGVKDILKDTDSDAHTKANAICDFLDIPKRYNRSAIHGVLVSNTEGNPIGVAFAQRFGLGDGLESKPVKPITKVKLKN